MIPMFQIRTSFCLFECKEIPSIISSFIAFFHVGIIFSRMVLNKIGDSTSACLIPVLLAKGSEMSSQNLTFKIVFINVLHIITLIFVSTLNYSKTLNRICHLFKLYFLKLTNTTTMVLPLIVLTVRILFKL